MKPRRSDRLARDAPRPGSRGGRACGGRRGSGVGGAEAAVERRSRPRPAPSAAAEPFWGAHQAGIVTPAQAHTYFAAFDLHDRKRDDVVKMLRPGPRPPRDDGRPDRRADRRRT